MSPKPLDITDPCNWNGCRDVANQIQHEIGGATVKITPLPPNPTLGPYRGTPTGWDHHWVVIVGDTVYDGFTPAGLPTSEFERLFEYPDAINFPWRQKQ